MLAGGSFIFVIQISHLVNLKNRLVRVIIIDIIVFIDCVILITPILLVIVLLNKIFNSYYSSILGVRIVAIILLFRTRHKKRS